MATQFEVFQRSMTLLFFLGQCLGLCPIVGVYETDVAKIRFSFFSWRSIHSIIIGTAQALVATLCLLKITSGVTIAGIGFVSFYFSTCCTTFLMVQIGSKWPKLMRELSDSALDSYIDLSVKRKCFMACVIMTCLAFVEHALLIVSNFSDTYSCDSIEMYTKYLKKNMPWYLDLNVLPKHISIGISLQILNGLSTLNWNYSDLYIICMSAYLGSILKEINKKIISASEKNFTPCYHWKLLREDFNRATRLVRSFDDVISGVIFLSFACNLFFICLQLFNILSNGITSTSTTPNITCVDNASPTYFSPFRGHEHSVYLIFSTLYLFIRSLVVTLLAAKINTAAVAPAPALYNVPSTGFCPEVSRFIDQIHGNTVALSGFQFFYVTRDVVLSVAGTIITYELVLLQFGHTELDKINSK